MNAFIIKYKVLLVAEDFLIGAKGYKLFKSYDEGKTWKYWTRLKRDKYYYFSFIRFFARLVRAEVSNLYYFNGTYICIAKKGIFVYDNNSNLFLRRFKVKRGSRPLNIAFDTDGYAYFGEYFSNENKEKVNIYKSDDKGITWKNVFTFPEKSIRHIHGIHYDIFENKLWVTTGDEDSECLIGYTSDRFNSFNILFRGNQKYRAVNLLFTRDYIYYGTDTPKEENFIYSIDRKTYEIKKRQKLQGSVIYSGVINNYLVINTTDEKSVINTDNHSYIWISSDGSNWKCIFKGKKDKYPYILQFASCIFPNYYKNNNRLYAFCRAIKNYDGKTIRMDLL